METNYKIEMFGISKKTLQWVDFTRKPGDFRKVRTGLRKGRLIMAHSGHTYHTSAPNSTVESLQKWEKVELICLLPLSRRAKAFAKRIR